MLLIGSIMSSSEPAGSPVNLTCTTSSCSAAKKRAPESGEHAQVHKRRCSDPAPDPAMIFEKLTSLSVNEAKHLIHSSSSSRACNEWPPEKPTKGSVFRVTQGSSQRLMRKFCTRGFQLQSSKEFPMSSTNNNVTCPLVRLRYEQEQWSGDAEYSTIDLWCLKTEDTLKLMHFYRHKKKPEMLAKGLESGNNSMLKLTEVMLKMSPDIPLFLLKPSIVIVLSKKEMKQQMEDILTTELRPLTSKCHITMSYETKAYSDFFRSVLSISDVRILDSESSEFVRTELAVVLHEDNQPWVHQTVFDWLSRHAVSLQSQCFNYTCSLEMLGLFQIRFPLAQWTGLQTEPAASASRAQKVRAATMEGRILTMEGLMLAERDLQTSMLLSTALALQNRSKDIVINPLLMQSTANQGESLEESLKESICNQSVLLSTQKSTNKNLSTSGNPRELLSQLTPGSITYLPKPDLYLLRGQAVESTLPVTVRLSDKSCSLGCSKEPDSPQSEPDSCCVHVDLVRLALDHGLVDKSSKDSVVVKQEHKT